MPNTLMIFNPQRSAALGRRTQLPEEFGFRPLPSGVMSPLTTSLPKTPTSVEDLIYTPPSAVPRGGAGIGLTGVTYGHEGVPGDKGYNLDDYEVGKIVGKAGMAALNPLSMPSFLYDTYKTSKEHEAISDRLQEWPLITEGEFDLTPPMEDITSGQFDFISPLSDLPIGDFFTGEGPGPGEGGGDEGGGYYGSDSGAGGDAGGVAGDGGGFGYGIGGGGTW
jgi:hypothetical protein